MLELLLFNKSILFFFLLILAYWFSKWTKCCQYTHNNYNAENIQSNILIMLLNWIPTYVCVRVAL